MGVLHADKFFFNCGKKINLSDLKGKTITIDMMTYSYKIYAFNSENENIEPVRWMREVMEFIQRFLKCQIKCICVFDGRNKPVEKDAVLKKRKEALAYYTRNGIDSNPYQKVIYKKSSLAATPKVYSNTNYLKKLPNLSVHEQDINKKRNEELELLKSGNIDTLQNLYPNKTIPEIWNTILSLPYERNNVNTTLQFPTSANIRSLGILLSMIPNCEVLIADGEGESLCCSLLENGKADIVLSQDTDVLIYVASKILKYSSSTYHLYNLSEILDQRNLSFDELRTLCFILGTDYNKGLKDYAFVKGYKLIKEIGWLKVKEKFGDEYDRLIELFTPNSNFQVIQYTQKEKNDLARLITH
jgi:5'-3' exonuclease